MDQLRIKCLHFSSFYAVNTFFKNVCIKKIWCMVLKNQVCYHWSSMIPNYFHLVSRWLVLFIVWEKNRPCLLGWISKTHQASTTLHSWTKCLKITCCYLLSILTIYPNIWSYFVVYGSFLSFVNADEYLDGLCNETDARTL